MQDGGHGLQHEASSPLGLNEWLVKEKYQQYLVNPASVEAFWRGYFNGIAGAEHMTSSARVVAVESNVDGRPVAMLGTGSTPVTPGMGASLLETRETTATSSRRSNGATPPAAGPAADLAVAAATPLRGAPAKLAANMTDSLGVPTATSVHPLPAVALEANRKLINDHLAKTGGSKVSYTHLVAYAVVRGLHAVPVLNSSYVTNAGESAAPGVIHHDHIGLGLAIDLERRDGRALVVGAVHQADRLSFAGFVEQFDDIVTRARDGKLTAEDFAGVTVTITNPGGLGTSQSVPRLMAGQGAIIGIGSIDFPVEFAATQPATLRDLGISKIVTLTSTYDHRIIQGAESGLFLKYVHELLVGEHGFYEDVFSSVGLSAAPARLTRHSAPPVAAALDARIAALIDTYRTDGHLGAWIDPLASSAPAFPAHLDPVEFGFSVFDIERTFAVGGAFGAVELTLGELLSKLRTAYCDTIGVEYRHLRSRAERSFVEERLERVVAEPTPAQRLRTLDYLERAETFERFLQTRYPALKRFSLEGGDAAIPFLDSVLEAAARHGATEAVIGMSHRGRLNTLANIIGKPVIDVLAEFEENLDPFTAEGAGDVKYHKGGHGTWIGASGEVVEMTLAANPSHLEAVDPVVGGIARARQDALGPDGESRVVPILIHGDASMMGQGIVAETLNLSLLAANRTGGTIHLIINNQVGFTTDPESARSTLYASDIAKSIGAPVLHVNGDDADAVVRCAQIATEYRSTFGKDVVVDMVCYRLHGHQESDDPTYTQPAMYRTIASHDSPRTIYAAELIEQGVLTIDEASARIGARTDELVSALAATRASARPHLEALPARPFAPMPSLSVIGGVNRVELDAIVHFLHEVPDGFAVHPKIERQLEQRLAQYEEGSVDWAHGESLAYATLLLEGTSIRLIGQDTRRGTFAHRHAALSDNESNETYIPLEALAAGSAGGGLYPSAPTRFKVWDSVLSELAELGFEYGYTLGDPESLVLWEAQFGDFANGAQAIFDTFISASEEKWGQRSGIVLLLPHGYEGQGPEHSSARVERYLQLATGGNFTVVQPTTASQFFHLIRAQAHLAERRPVVVMSPKSLLRSKVARSPIEEFVAGSFRSVLVDAPLGSSTDVRRVVLGSGRIVEDLIGRRDKVETSGGAPVAIFRVEQLSPWPTADLGAALAAYPNAAEVIWAQDEPENMGALTYALPRLECALGDRFTIRAVSRRAAGSPATGSHELHLLERDMILDQSVGLISQLAKHHANEGA